MPRRQNRSYLLQERVQRLLDTLEQTYPEAPCALVHESPFQLLVATILSAQCTDERVNLVTPELFRRYPTAEKLATAQQADVEALIHSTGFYRAKAGNIIGMAQGLVAHHGGEVPPALEALIELPGVGRKTANVVMGTAFGLPSGIVVDTHVKRLSRLLGLTTATTPEQIEQDLMRLVPVEHWINLSHRLIHHGRKICIARRPRCTECPLLPDCPRTGLPPISPVAGKLPAT